MKIVYSYIPYDYFEGKKMPIELCLITYLSVLRARRLYKEVVLYTNEEIKEQMYELEIPFTSIDSKVLANEKAKCPSIPKLKTYIAQTEPYMHIDLDTILYEKPIYNKTIPIQFAHLDLVANNICGISHYKGIHEAYILPFFDDVLPEWYGDVNMESIPNMNIVIANNPQMFADCVKGALGLYHLNKEYFDAQYYRFCTIEQLAIYAELIKKHPEYHNLSMDRAHVMHENEACVVTNNKFPFIMMLNNFNKRSIHFHQIDDIKKVKNDNFGGYLHLCGSMKTESVIQAIIIQDLITNFSSAPLKKLDKYFNGLEKIKGIEYLEDLGLKI